MSKTKKTDKADAPLEEGDHNFSHFLGRVEGGALHKEAGRMLRQANVELARRAAKAGKATGKVILTFTFAHEADGVVRVQGDVETKLPKVTPARSFFWITDSGNLVTRDPRQMTLGLRAVDDDQEAEDAPEEEQPEVKEA